MDQDPFASPHAQGWLLNSALAPHVDAFVAHLRRGRYAASTTKRYFSGMAHFAHWMSSATCRRSMLDEACIDQFLRYHLPRCDCPAPVVRAHRRTARRAWPPAGVLREQGVIAEPPPPTGPIADELRRYDAHMRDARGLAARDAPRSPAHR